jgi:hypothetical protein
VRTARYTALAALRRERLLKRREQIAAAARRDDDDDDDDSQAGPPGDLWEPLAPLLDEAVARLNATDRAAIVLRYFQGKTFAEVATAIGSSENTATKRVARAVDKLRDFLARRGITVAPAVLGPILLERAIHTAPPGLAASATAAATSPAQAGTHALSALLADEALKLASTPSRPLLISAIAALLLVALLWAGLAARLGHVSPTLAQPLTRTGSTAPTTAPLIRVGYYLSHQSAVSIDWTTRQPYGYSTRLLQDLRDPSFDVIPVIEPGTQQIGDLPGVLATSFPGKRPMNVQDPAALATLDVLVAGAPNVPEEALTSIEAAVTGGMGLMVRSLFAVDAPGFTPVVQRLYDLKSSYRCGGSIAVEAEVLVEHPILSSRTGKPGQIVKMRPVGAYGPLGPGSTGLIRVIDGSTMRPIPAEGVVHTVYVHELGRGRIVCCCFTTYDVAKNLSDSVGPQFALRAVQWLARRAVQ